MIIPTDCKRLVQQISNSDSNFSPLGVVIDAMVIELHTTGNPSFRFYPRGTNRVAHGLANLGTKCHVTSHSCILDILNEWTMLLS